MFNNTRNFFRGFGGEFRKFIEKGNAIDMAVGVIVGAALSGLVNSLVKDIIMPPIGLLLKGVDFSEIFIVLKHGKNADATYHTIAQATADGATTLNIGIFFNALISFFITMFAIFLFVKAVNKIRAMSAKKEEATTRVCPYCVQKISIDASKCLFCCSDVPPVEKACEVCEEVPVGTLGKTKDLLKSVGSKTLKSVTGVKKKITKKKSK